MHLQKGITLFSQTLRGYYASSAGHTYLNITLRNMPISGKETLTDILKDTFDSICPIASIKPLLYASTKLLSDQWMVSLDITDKEQIVGKFPRILNILDHKVTLHWRNAPILCHFCDKEGHTRKDCPDFIESKKGRSILNELKEAQKSEKLESQAINEEPTPSVILEDTEKNPFIVHEDNTSQTAPEASSLFEESQDSDNGLVDSSTMEAVNQTEMDTSLNHPRDFECTPSPTETSLGKRPERSGSSQTLPQPDQGGNNWKEVTGRSRKNKNKQHSRHTTSTSSSRNPKRNKPGSSPHV